MPLELCVDPKTTDRIGLAPVESHQVSGALSCLLLNVPKGSLQHSNPTIGKVCRAILLHHLLPCTETASVYASLLGVFCACKQDYHPKMAASAIDVFADMEWAACNKLQGHRQLWSTNMSKSR